MNGAKHRIQILLVDDHPVVRKGVRSFLAHRPNLNIVGEASNGKEAICKVRELSPDIVLMDVEMPEMDGLAVTEVLHKEFPQVKVLILSMYSNHQYMGRVIEAGARGSRLLQPLRIQTALTISRDDSRTIRENRLYN